MQDLRKSTDLGKSFRMVLRVFLPLFLKVPKTILDS